MKVVKEIQIFQNYVAAMDGKHIRSMKWNQQTAILYPIIIISGCCFIGSMWLVLLLIVNWC